VTVGWADRAAVLGASCAAGMSHHRAADRRGATGLHWGSCHAHPALLCFCTPLPIFVRVVTMDPALTSAAVLLCS
jgi:hypothetical protein